MNKFDKMFAEAVQVLLEKDKEGDKQRPSAFAAIEWKPGPGRWNDVIRGLKKDADDLPYEEAISKSSAVGARSATLMAKLGVTKKSTKTESLEAAAEVLNQAVMSPAMSQLYGKTRVDKNSLIVPVKLSMNKEEAASGEGITGRNATVFIHLTLLGAYNAGMFLPTQKLKIVTASPSTGAVVIQKA